MAAHVIKVPDVGEGIAEVELVAWHVQPGDTVAEDQALADVMTDKASVEIPSPVAGRVATLGWCGGPDAGGGRRADPHRDGCRHGPRPRSGTSPAAPAPTATATAKPAATPADVPPARPASFAPSASPAVPGIASPALAPPRLGTGRGPEGPACHRHRRPHHPGRSGRLPRRPWSHRSRPRALGGSPVTGTERHDQQVLPVLGLRRRIAIQMQEAKRRIPHFSYVEEVDVTDLEATRSALNAQWGTERGRLTPLPLLMRAVVLALRAHPRLNAWFDDEAGQITQHGGVHIGVATDTRHGLLVPVVRHAEARSVWAMAAEVTRLADAARAGRATRAELSGSTITISSLGALGGIVSTPVINRPEVAIVGVNRIVERPMLRGGMVVARRMMNLSSSFDHRVVDGIDAARFIQAVRELLETPALLFADAG
jgi:2-oxoisovalerate dehydrogenase E2 component (dihydrolipoyl transacylase)